MDHFTYRGDALHCEEVPLAAIADAVGTPFFCYSGATLLRHLQAFQGPLKDRPHLVCYSVKANSNLAVLDLLAKNGAGFDIVSGGELERVKRIGCAGERVVYSGVGKSETEIRAALDYGVLMFNVESLPELHRIDRIAGEMGKRAGIALRVNPDVDAGTHPYISTGLKANKFGIPHQEAVAAYKEAAGLANIDVIGLDCHIGSQLTSEAPFVHALERVTNLMVELGHEGIPIRYLDLGGGLGIPYGDGSDPPPPSKYVEALLDAMGSLDVTLVFEPGRAIAGNAGVLVTRVEYVKQGEEKTFVITDGAMNDLIRPSLYDAFHDVLPVVRREGGAAVKVDVVGPICETGDFFARDHLLQEMAEGEYLAVRSAGAYGFVMSSNYNTRPRAAEVMVKSDRFQVVRERENLIQLLAGERTFQDG